jgi:hypothetical protein
MDKLLVIREGTVELFGPRTEVLARLTRGAVPAPAIIDAATGGQQGGWRMSTHEAALPRLGEIATAGRTKRIRAGPDHHRPRPSSFGGGWMALAPIAGAVIAQGAVKVDMNRKTVQHQEGGIVKEILVRDGDRVQQGQTAARARATCASTPPTTR